MIKLATWTKQNNLSYRTAWEWAKNKADKVKELIKD